jgi:hypothetical protein
MGLSRFWPSKKSPAVLAGKSGKAITFWLIAALIFCVTFIIASFWNSLVGWYEAHQIETDRTKDADAVLIVALDDRLDGTGALPDTLMLYWPETREFESIDRGWKFSKLDPDPSLVESYLGVLDCKTFCGIQGVYAQSFLLNWNQGTRETALEQLRQVVAREYELSSLALVVFDLKWSKSFFKCLGPLELEVRERIPIGGEIVDGGLQNFRGYIEPGKQVLNPTQVFWFARAREGSSNSARMNRQEAIVESILNESSRLKVLACIKDSSGYLVFDFTSKDIGLLWSMLFRNP